MAEDTLATLTTFQWSLLFLGLVLIILLFIVMLFYIGRKYPKQSTTLDPIFKSFLIVLILFMVHLTAVTFGVATRESLQRATKWYIVAGVVLVVWYAVIVPYFINRPIPTSVLFKRYVLPDIREMFQGRVYIGQGYFPPFMFSRVIPSTYGTGTDKSRANLMEVFLVLVHHSNTFFVLMIRDKYTGESLENIRNPSLSKVNELLGREAMRSMDEKLKEYDTSQTEKQGAAQ